MKLDMPKAIGVDKTKVPKRTADDVLNAPTVPLATKSRKQQAQQAAPPPTAAPATQPLTPEQRRKRVARDAAILKTYVAANGSMSVARREQTVQPALQRLGYTQEQAKRISIAAPLESRMSDDQALGASLDYAAASTPEAVALDPDSLHAANTPNPQAMPKRARQVWERYQQQQHPMAWKNTKFRLGLLGGFEGFREKVAPIMDRMANIPVPGGIGGMFALNLLFLAIIVPANPAGYTRAQLLWLTLLNRTKLPEAVDKPPIPADPLWQGLTNATLAVEDTANAVKGVASALGYAGAIPSLLQQAGAAAGGALGGVAGALTGGRLADSGTPTTPTSNPTAPNTTFVGSGPAFPDQPGAPLPPPPTRVGGPDVPRFPGRRNSLPAAGY